MQQVEEHNQEVMNELRHAREQFEKALSLVTAEKQKYLRLEDKLSYVAMSLKVQEGILSRSGFQPTMSYAGTTSALNVTGSNIFQSVSDQSTKGRDPWNYIEQMASDATVSGYAGYMLIRQAPEDTASELLPPSTEFDMDRLLKLASSINPEIERMFHGARDVLETDSKDKGRQACHSLRDALMHISKTLAPDEKIKKTDWFLKAKDSKSGVTRRHRLVYLALGKNAEAAIPSLEEIELISNALEVYDDIIANSHQLEEAAESEVWGLFTSFGMLVTRLLELHFQNS